MPADSSLRALGRVAELRGGSPNWLCERDSMRATVEGVAWTMRPPMAGRPRIHALAEPGRARPSRAVPYRANGRAEPVVARLRNSN